MYNGFKFLMSYYGDECYIDCYVPIDKINLNGLVNVLASKDNVNTIIITDLHCCVIVEYHVKEDCFSLIPKNIKERKFAYELRDLYKRCKKN